MATYGQPPTMTESLRGQVQENQSQRRHQREQMNQSRVHFRESVRTFMNDQQIEKVPMTHGDLREFTDVQFYASHSFANFASFCCMIGVIICLGWFGWGRDIVGSYKDIHDRYQTLMTSVFWSNTAWIVIFILEAVFIFYQFLPAYTDLNVVIQGVGWNFFFVNCCQIAWVVSYCFDYVWLAAIFMALNVGVLSFLNSSLYRIEYIDEPAKEFLNTEEELEVKPAPVIPEALKNLNFVVEFVVFRMPFQLHLGWALFIFLLNVNEIWASRELPAASIVALASICLLWVFGIIVLFLPKYPLFVAPLMIAWGAIGIWIEISNPTDDILLSKDEMDGDGSSDGAVGFEENEISRMKGAAIATAVEHILLPIVKFAIQFATTYKLTEKLGEQNIQGV